MAHRVEVDTKRRTRLVLVFRRTHGECVLFALVQIGDEEVQMKLLGDRPVGPRWRHEVRDLLESDRWVGPVVQFDPLDVFGPEIPKGLDVETGEARVEISELERIGAVQSDELISGSHVGHLGLLLLEMWSDECRRGHSTEVVRWLGVRDVTELARRGEISRRLGVPVCRWFGRPLE